MKLGKLIITVSVLILIAASGCKKIDQEIVGAWNFQTFDATPQGNYTWTFIDNGTLLRSYYIDGVMNMDSCKYSVNQTIFKKLVVISDSYTIRDTPEINGTYRVDKFKDDILIMTRTKLADGEKGGAYFRCELIRR